MKDGEMKDGDVKDGKMKDGKMKDGKMKDGEMKNGEMKKDERKDRGPQEGKIKEDRQGTNVCEKQFRPKMYTPGAEYICQHPGIYIQVCLNTHSEYRFTF